MPVDPELRAAWLHPAPIVAAQRVTLVTADGRVVSEYPGMPGVDGSHCVEGYVSHWATCVAPPPRTTKKAKGPSRRA